MKSVFFTSPSIPNEELYCLRKFCSVIEDGPKELNFEEEAIAPSNADEEEETNDIDGGVFCEGNRAKDIEFVWNQGLLVNKDNDPAPENVPQEQVRFVCLIDGQSWGYNGINKRATLVPVNQEPSFQGGWNPGKKFLLQVLKKMVPYKFYMNLILKQTSSCLVGQHLPPLTEGEFQ